jgi:hypothetical protein
MNLSRQPTVWRGHRSDTAAPAAIGGHHYQASRRTRSNDPHIKKAGDSMTSTEQTESDWVYKLGRLHMRARDDDLKFRLNVVAPTVADVVTHVGGWLVDRAMLGWDITVLIAQSQPDFRPLHILGAEPVALDSVLTGRTRLPVCDAISVDADLYFGDARVRRHVLGRLDGRRSEFTLWGGDWPTESDGCAAVAKTRVIIEHRLSLAARLFKAHAVAAALESWPEGAVGPTETFCDGRLRDGFRPNPLRAVSNAVADADSRANPDADPTPA